jgi:hypothetical protein
MQLMSISRAARHLGYKSRSQLYKLIDDGWLDDHLHINMPSGQRLLDVDGLREKLQSICQWRIDSVFLRRSVIQLAEDS